MTLRFATGPHSERDERRSPRIETPYTSPQRTSANVFPADGESALLRCGEGEPDLAMAIVDLRLPDTDGLTLATQIRQRRPDCPIILMTAYGTPEVVRGAEALGAPVITKPFNVDELLSLVSERLRPA